MGSRRSRVGSQDCWPDHVSEHHHWTHCLTPPAPLSRFLLGLAAGISQNTSPSTFLPLGRDNVPSSYAYLTQSKYINPADNSSRIFMSRE